MMNAAISASAAKATPMAIGTTLEEEDPLLPLSLMLPVLDPLPPVDVPLLIIDAVVLDDDDDDDEVVTSGAVVVVCAADV